MRRYLLLIIVVIIIGIAVWWGYSGGLSGQNITIQPLPTPVASLDRVSALQISPIPNATSSVSFTTAFPSPVVPDKVQEYQLTKTDPTAKVQQIVKNLGMTTPPEVFKGSRPTTIWSNSNSSFSLQEKPWGFSYQFTGTTNGALPTISEAQQIVKDFLSKHGLVNQQVVLGPGQGNYYQESGSSLSFVRSSAQADMVLVSFPYLVNSLPLYQPDGVQYGIDARIGKGGAILSISGNFPPGLGTAKTSQIFSVDQAVTLLKANKGTLVTVSYNTVEESSPVDVYFSGANIRHAALGYVVFDQQNAMRPVYLFSGDALNTNQDTKDGLVTYLVPATPN